MDVLTSIFIVSFFTHGLRFATLDGNVLSVLITPFEWLQSLYDDGKNSLTRFVGYLFVEICKPLYTCVYCMASLWTIVLVLIDVIHFNLISWEVAVVIAGACGLNVIINQIINRE